MSDAFHRVISDHLALRERNKRLEQQMPLDRYRVTEGGGLVNEESSFALRNEPGTKTIEDVREQEQWLDHDSSWDTTLERPLPEFDWAGS
jgi:hypothetical protein